MKPRREISMEYISTPYYSMFKKKTDTKFFLKKKMTADVIPLAITPSNNVDSLRTR